MSGPLPAATREGLALARELSLVLGPGAVSTEPSDLGAAARDGWPRLRLSALAGQTRWVPDLIAAPADVAQVQAAIRFAGERRIPLVPVGGGGGGNGAALAVRGGIALDLKKLSAPPRIDAEKRTVDVEAGFNLSRLEEALLLRGMTLGAPPINASNSTVGGFLATRSGGATSAQLGKAEDLLLALSAVDGTGALLKAQEGPRRGVDLAQLLLGSEGTLAVITSARLRIAARPRAQALLGLRCGSMVDGMRALQAIVRAGFRPSLTRLLDPLSALIAGLHSSRRSSATSLPARLRALLTGGQQELLRGALRAPRLLNGIAEALGGSARLLLRIDGHGPRAEDDAAEEIAAILRICQEACGCEPIDKREVEEALRRRDGEDHPQLIAAGAFVEELDVAATWEKLPAVLGALRRGAAPHALLLARIGCAYLEGASIEATLIGPAGPLAQAVQRAQARPSSSQTGERDDFHEELSLAELRSEQALSSTLAVALDAGAVLSHASGVGLARQLLLPREHGEGMRQLRALKRAFDPYGILNPGKLLL